MNNLYELGGLADVFIINKVEKNIGGINYKPQEVYTVLNDVIVNLAYERNNSEGKDIKNKINYIVNFPNEIYISNVPMTEKVCNLLMQKENDTNLLITKKEIIECTVQNKLFLSDIPSKDIYVKDKNYNNLEYEVADYTLTGNFIEGETYLVFYKTYINKSVFNMEKVSMPYFSLEIHFKGNDNKKTTIGYMIVPSVSLISSPVVVFNSNTIVGSNLNFKIIDVNNEPSVWGI